jgi:hypothetical protein
MIVGHFDSRDRFAEFGRGVVHTQHIWNIFLCHFLPSETPPKTTLFRLAEEHSNQIWHMNLLYMSLSTCIFHYAQEVVICCRSRTSCKYSYSRLGEFVEIMTP